MLRMLAGGAFVGFDLLYSLLSATVTQAGMMCAPSVLLSLAAACGWASACSSRWFDGFQDAR